MDEEKDYLDELIQEHILKDPELAKRWEEMERAQALAQLRVEAGLTQKQLAERMGVRRERVAVIESRPNRIPFGVILQYVEAVGGKLALQPPSSVNTGKPKVGRPVSSKRSKASAA